MQFKSLHAAVGRAVTKTMKRTLLALALLLTAAILVWAQRERFAIPSPYPQLEVRSVFPREISPGKYEQVEQRELQTLAQQGWELVSVMPYIYRNEEHGPELQGPKPVVTQSYPAYFFKRVRLLPPARE
jgi:hypothetical protein